MNLKTIVVDTNVLISSVLNPLGTPNQAITKVITYFQLIQSESTYEELVTRIQKKKFDRYLSVEDRADFLAMIHRMHAIVYPVIAEYGGTVVKEEADNIFAVFPLSLCYRSI